MCGIFGMVHFTPQKGAEVQKRLNLLFKLTEPRGRQASGVAIYNQSKVSIYKRPVTSSLLIGQKNYKDFLKESLSQKSKVSFIGHCRLVTDGSELNSFNNQPLEQPSFVGVHNGVINNFSKIKKALSISPRGSSDSEVLFSAIKKESDKSGDLTSAIKSVSKMIRGAFSVGIIDPEKKECVLFSNFGSLYYIKDKDNFFAFASEKSILTKFSKELGASLEVVQVKSNSGISIDLENNQIKKISSDKENDIQEKRKIHSFLITNNSSHFSDFKRCNRCILPVHYPFLSINKDGVCSHCLKYEKQSFKGKDQLEKFLAPYRSKNGDIDCLVGLSGGRDSSYGLHILKKELGMNPIGFCYDWLLTSNKARHNVAKMAGALGVEVIYRCGNYEVQASNILKNINGFLKTPDLGMMTFVQSGDKEMYHYGRQIRKEVGVDLTVWCSGYQLEQREFFVGYCGIDKTLKNNPRLYDYGWDTKIRLAIYYAFKTIKNPYFWNRSIIDNALAFWHCFVAKDDFLYLYNYYPWKEEEVERTLTEEYDWEIDKDYGKNQWRMDDFHTSFINYVYYTVGGFSEFDEFRSNQVREGLITREEALNLAQQDNLMKYESLKEFSRVVGFNLEHVLKKIDSIPKTYL